MKLQLFVLTLSAISFCVAAEQLPAGHPPVGAENSKRQAAPTQLPQKAKVLDVINVPQYTYLEVQQGDQSRWLAGPSVDVKKGDTVLFDNGMEMKDFHSNTLDRTFPSIFFVNRMEVGR